LAAARPAIRISALGRSQAWPFAGVDFRRELRSYGIVFCCDLLESCRNLVHSPHISDLQSDQVAANASSNHQSDGSPSETVY
jgi:hypothetical protein